MRGGAKKKKDSRHFKKGCRRERGMAIVERRLYDRKELWMLNIDGK